MELAKTYTKQIKCIILKINVMRSIFILLLGLFISCQVFSQVTTDTVYSNEWNGKTQKWERFDRIITTYNIGLITSELVQVWQNDHWIDYNMKMTYYNNDQVIEELEQYWNPADQSWEDNYRKLYSYNKHGQVSQISHQHIYNGKYFDTSKEIMKYSPEGLLIEKIVQRNDEAWTNFMRYQYYYNANDLLIEEELTYWNEGEWDETRTVVHFVYNSKGQIAEKKKARKIKTKSRNLLKEEFYYGGNGRLEEHIVSVWNGGNKKWNHKNRALFVNIFSAPRIMLSIILFKLSNIWKTDLSNPGPVKPRYVARMYAKWTNNGQIVKRYIEDIFHGIKIFSQVGPVLRISKYFLHWTISIHLQFCMHVLIKRVYRH